ncbi:MAG TPA: hypothetical protein VHB68_16095 [Steroidobacteraceae bacterium]|nr:hypothetical protein [Steroidobacteraceae bacterium]
MSTTLDKLRGAALSLARSGSIKDRLTDAYRNHLSQVDESELPAELVEEFRAVSHALNRERPLLRGEDAFRATVRKMSSLEADEVASSVVRMFGALSREPSGVRAKVTKSGTSQIISRYPAESWTVVDRIDGPADLRQSAVRRPSPT